MIGVIERIKNSVLLKCSTLNEKIISKDLIELIDEGIYHFAEDLSSLLNGSIYFGFLFVASDLTHSPNTKTGMMIYGLLIGVLTAILGIFLPIYEISYISILLVSFLIPLIDKIIVKKFIKWQNKYLLLENFLV